MIVSTGAIKTPQLLQVSGVGPAALLSQHGVPVVLDKPGVGENLQDHLQVMLVYRLDGIGTLNQAYNSLTGKMRIFAQYVFSRSGPMGSGATPLGIFVRSDDSHDRANLGYTILPYSRKSAGLKTEFHSHPGVTLSVYDCRPTSRGTITLTGGEMAAAPDIRFNYLTTEHDRRVAIDAMRFTRKLMRQPAVAPFNPVELRPGPQTGDDDAALLEAFRGQRDDDLSPGRHCQDGPARRRHGGGRHSPAGHRPRRTARDRRVGDADGDIRQYQCADHDDRGKGRGNDLAGYPRHAEADNACPNSDCTPGAILRLFTVILLRAARAHRQLLNSEFGGSMADAVATGTKIVRRENKNPQQVGADICVVGAGSAGVSAALEAAKLGRKVILVDGLPTLGGQMVNSIIGTFCGLFANGTHGIQFTYGMAEDMLRDLEKVPGRFIAATGRSRPSFITTRSPSAAGPRKRSARPASRSCSARCCATSTWMAAA